MSKSVVVIELFGCVFVRLLRFRFENKVSVGKGNFVIGLNQISSFFYDLTEHILLVLVEFEVNLSQ